MAGNGGFVRGWPRLPSSDSSSAVSSPQMYAPAPRWSDDRDVAEQLARAHLLERVDEHLELVLVLAADVDEDVLRLDPVRRDQAALEEAERDAQHDLAVLERARLGLVGVDDEVVRLRRSGRASGRSSTCGPWGRTRRRDRAGRTRSAPRSPRPGVIARARASAGEPAAGVVVLDLGDRAAVRAGEDDLGSPQRQPRRSSTQRASSATIATSPACTCRRWRLLTATTVAQPQPPRHSTVRSVNGRPRSSRRRGSRARARARRRPAARR